MEVFMLRINILLLIFICHSLHAEIITDGSLGKDGVFRNTIPNSDTYFINPSGAIMRYLHLHSLKLQVAH